MMAMLKLPNLTWHIQVGTTNIGGAVQQAVNALLAGVCKYAVVWRAMHNPRGTYQNLPAAWPRAPPSSPRPTALAGRGRAWRSPIPAGSKRNNQNREKMATLAVTQRKHTQHNPHAYFYGTELTREDYFASRMVAYPFCLFDCDIPVQGAVAIVLTTAERARDLKPTPAYLAGYGQRLHFEVAGRIGSLSSYMEGGSSSAKLTWERSGFSPKDVDVAQIYDGFSASVIYGLESLRLLQGRRGARLHPGRPHRTRRRIAAQHLWRQPRHRPHPRPVAHHRGRPAGLGPRRLAPGQGRQRLLCRRQRPDRDRHDVYLRQGALLKPPPRLCPAPRPLDAAALPAISRIAAAVVIGVSGGADRCRRGAAGERIGGAGDRTASGPERPADNCADRTRRRTAGRSA